MSQPTDIDVDVSGISAKQYMSEYSDEGKWCYAGIDAVESLLKEFDFLSNVRLIPGDVLETLKQHKPEKISILRLDTDWYESTKFELEKLYERLVPNGILIIDDYGHWKGARLAVDDFFEPSDPLSP